MLAKYKWIIAGAAFIGVGCYFLSSDRNETENLARKKLTREKVLQISKELKKELIPVFITLASFAISIKEKLGGRVANEELKNLLLRNSPMPLQLSQAERKVYNKHNIEQADFQSICENEFSGDAEIQGHLTQMRGMMEAAFRGEHPNANVNLPEFLTAEFTLRVIEQLYDVSKYCTYKKLQELHNFGVPLESESAGFADLSQALEAETLEAKAKIFENFGMHNLEESPNLLMHVAMQKYKEDFKFIIQLGEIEKKFENTMNLISAGKLPQEEAKRLEGLFGQIRLIEELDEPREVVEDEFIEEIE